MDFGYPSLPTLFGSKLIINYIKNRYGFWKVMVLLLTSSVALGANGVQLIIWSVWKRLFVKLSSRKNIKWLCFSTWRRLTIHHGNMELCVIWVILVLKADCQFLLIIFYQIAILKFLSEPLVLVCKVMGRGFRRAASYLLLCLVLSNNIVNVLNPGADCSLYVDDFFYLLQI